jgi:hypothetical protein
MRNRDNGRFTRSFRVQFFKGVVAIVVLLWVSVGIQWIDSRVRSGLVHSFQVERAQAQGFIGPEDWKAEVFSILKDFEVSIPVAKAVIRCESNFNPNAKGDSGKSLGIWQISTVYHDITPECAHDPVCSTYEAIRIIKDGRGWPAWTCYRKLFTSN